MFLSKPYRSTSTCKWSQTGPGNNGYPRLSLFGVSQSKQTLRNQRNGLKFSCYAIIRKMIRTAMIRFPHCLPCTHRCQCFTASPCSRNSNRKIGCSRTACTNGNSATPAGTRAAHGGTASVRGSTAVASGIGAPPGTQAASLRRLAAAVGPPAARAPLLPPQQRLG